MGEAVAVMNLGHVVITSVNRDELPDGGAAIWAETIREIRKQSPGTSIEVLIPDFCGDWNALQLVIDVSGIELSTQRRLDEHWSDIDLNHIDKRRVVTRRGIAHKTNDVRAGAYREIFGRIRLKAS